MHVSDSWIDRKWRPWMAVTYMAINICDFIVFPVLFTIAQFWEGEGSTFRQWSPITLQAGGLIHVAFGAVLGITAWGRSQEKVQAIKQGKPDV